MVRTCIASLLGAGAPRFTTHTTAVPARLQLIMTDSVWCVVSKRSAKKSGGLRSSLRNSPTTFLNSRNWLKEILFFGRMESFLGLKGMSRWMIFSMSLIFTSVISRRSSACCSTRHERSLSMRRPWMGLFTSRNRRSVLDVLEDARDGLEKSDIMDVGEFGSASEAAGEGERDRDTERAGDAGGGGSETEGEGEGACEGGGEGEGEGEGEGAAETEGGGSAETEGEGSTSPSVASTGTGSTKSPPNNSSSFSSSSSSTTIPHSSANSFMTSFTSSVISNPSSKSSSSLSSYSSLSSSPPPFANALVPVQSSISIPPSPTAAPVTAFISSASHTFLPSTFCRSSFCRTSFLWNSPSFIFLRSSAYPLGSAKPMPSAPLIPPMLYIA